MLLFNEQDILKRGYFKAMELNSIFHIKIIGKVVKYRNGLICCIFSHIKVSRFPHINSIDINKPGKEKKLSKDT